MSARPSSDGALTPPQGLARPDSRTIHRLPIRLAVSAQGRSAPLGTTRDISLHGAFIETSAPLPIGTVVPLSLDLDPAEPPLELRAEVKRVTDEGMGLRFVDAQAAAVRRLKKWIVDRTSVQGTQRQVEQLHDQARSIEPIREPGRIRGLLEKIIASGTTVLVIPVDRLARDRARLVAIGPDGLELATSDATSVTAGEEVYALAQLGYDAYSFGLRVRSAQGTKMVAQLPDHIVYSERRTKDRAPVEPGTVIRWPAPWDATAVVERPVLERSKEGLSFRVPPDGCLLTPGTPLPGAVLALRDHEEPLVAAEVRNITRVVEPDGAVWLRVGVSFGVRHEVARIESAERSRSRGPLAWLKRVIGKARTALSYGFHKGRERFFESASETQRVRIPGDPHPLVGLLDRTRSDERLRAPLVIVVPGFAGRKEQMAFFAGTVVDGFERNHQDVAVLRFDGSNNLGESGRDADCEGEGLQALHYTTSGQMRDIHAVLAWARKNPLVDPTQVILVSVSMGSIGVRHVMTQPEAADVGLWVSYMGAPDAIDVVRLVSGNIDLFEYWKRGQRLGVVSLNGVLTDGDRFWEDLHRLDIGDLPAAVREMGQIRADVLWLYGRHDAFMDPRRVREVMTAPHPEGSKRELVEVVGGHLPRTSDEAVTQFVALTRRIFHHVHKSPIEPFTPPVGRLAARAEAEWKAVRRAAPPDRGAWWKRYLLDPEGLGFDVLEHAPEYRQLMDRQAELLAGRDALLDLGAGTGNLTVRLLDRGAARIVATDLVPEALDALKQKVGPSRAPRVETLAADIDGGPVVALRRFAHGDLTSARALAERVPGVSRPAFEQLLALNDDAVMAALRGCELEPRAVARAHKLAAAPEALLGDLATLARFARGRLHPAVAGPALERLPVSILERPGGLPFADASFDGIGASLLLSYLDHPDDLLAECFRVLRPGGRLVVSSLVPDYDMSELYVAVVARFEQTPDAELPPGETRASLLASARRFVDHAAELVRLAEEGHFRLYDRESLLALVRCRGFVDASAEDVFGDPPQAVIVTCTKP